MKKLLLILSTVGVLFMGCSKSKMSGTSVAQLIGQWNLESYTEAKTDDLFGANISVTEENGKYIIGGYSGVNYFSQIVSKNGTAKLGENMGSTKMMGAPEENEFEDAFLNTLTNSDCWKLEEGKLIITAGPQKMVFVPGIINQE